MHNVVVVPAHGAGSREFPHSSYDVSEAGVLRVVGPDGHEIIFSPVGWSRVELVDARDKAS